MIKTMSEASVSQQLLHKLRLDIIHGKYPPGTQFPTVRTLAYEESINPNTVQRVLCMLEEDGLLLCLSTKGRFVTQDQAVIERVKAVLQTDYLERIRRGAKELGITKEQFMQFLEESEEEDT